jgi:hypothetical protein
VRIAARERVSLPRRMVGSRCFADWADCFSWDHSRASRFGLVSAKVPELVAQGVADRGIIHRWSKSKQSLLQKTPTSH